MREYIYFSILFTYFSIMTVGIGVASVIVFVPSFVLGLFCLPVLTAWGGRGVGFAAVSVFFVLALVIFFLQFLWVKLIRVGQVGYDAELKILDSTITASGYFLLFTMASRIALFITIIAIISKYLEFNEGTNNDKS